MDKIPALSDACGRYFSYRDFIECGETYKSVEALNNSPQQLATYVALNELAVNVLDKIIDQFGEIQLTYGFASRTLTRKISHRITPKLDQHASCERGPDGNLICKRRGAAVDFYAISSGSKKVARWVATNCDFDRLYFYGNDRPLHLSYGPEHSRQIIRFTHIANSRRKVPYRLTIDRFLQTTNEADGAG